MPDLPSEETVRRRHKLLDTSPTARSFRVRRTSPRGKPRFGMSKQKKWSMLTVTRHPTSQQTTSILILLSNSNIRQQGIASSTCQHLVTLKATPQVGFDHRVHLLRTWSFHQQHLPAERAQSSRRKSALLSFRASVDHLLHGQSGTPAALIPAERFAPSVSGPFPVRSFALWTVFSTSGLDRWMG